jgi:hypothetical protein
MIQLASASGNVAARVFFVLDLLHLDCDDSARGAGAARRIAVTCGLTSTVKRSPGRAWPDVP